MNTIMVIHPYKHEGMWVFDDESVELVREPFVAGADEIIETLVSELPNAEKGFSLVFSAKPFPGFQTVFDWRREEMGGNWYFNQEVDMEGWLCPALFKYFETAPEKIYVQFKAIPTD